MSTLYIGVDVSKGYIDLHVLDADGRPCTTGRFDDTAPGHLAVFALLQSISADAYLVGLESSGGLERNWERSFRLWQTHLPITVYTLNPLIVHRYLSRQLHRSVTDPASARGIAEYLRGGLRGADLPRDPTLEGVRDLYRTVRRATTRLTGMKNELQSVLPRVQPELVRYCRSGLPRWVLSLLCRYPTSPQLARAHAPVLARIPGVTLTRAQSLIDAARTSVAASRDEATAAMVRFEAQELLRLTGRIKIMQQQVCRFLTDDPALPLLTSIPGIGMWGAACLRVEIGQIERFPNPETLVAFAGLDPKVHQSGDTLRRMHISKHGRRAIRAILYPLTRTAIRCNPPITAFYQRLRGRGKPDMVCVVACMRKLLHLVYACWIKNQAFDPLTGTHEHLRSNTPPDGEDQILNRTPSLIEIEAPVSWREAKKRKAAAVPQMRYTHDERGPGATSRVNEITKHS